MQDANNKEISIHRVPSGITRRVQRSHLVLTEHLRHYLRDDQTNWDEWMPFATFVYNTTERSATGYTSFELIFGRKLTLPSAMKDNPGPQYNYDDYVTEMRSRLQTAHKVARENLVTNKEKSKEYYDKKGRFRTTGGRQSVII
jgi:hypothetical protein